MIKTIVATIALAFAGLTVAGLTQTNASASSGANCAACCTDCKTCCETNCGSCCG